MLDDSRFRVSRLFDDEALHRRITVAVRDIAYVTLEEVVDRMTTAPTREKVAFTTNALAFYMHEDEAERALGIGDEEDDEGPRSAEDNDDDDDPDRFDDDDQADNDDGDRADDAGDDRRPAHRGNVADARIRASLLWVAETAYLSGMGGRDRGTFKATWWKHKSMGAAASCRFEVVDTEYVNPGGLFDADPLADLDADAGPRPTVALPPEPDDARAKGPRPAMPLPNELVWDALAEQVRKGLTTSLAFTQAGATYGMQALRDVIRGQRVELARKDAELARAHRQIRDLWAKLSTAYQSLGLARAGQQLAEEGAERVERTSDTVERVAEQFFTEAGGLARTWMAVKAKLDPDLVELLELLNRHPKLSAALASREVREMLRDPANLDALADVLEAHAATWKAEREADAANPAP